MRLTAYLVLMLCISITFYWLGYSSAYSALKLTYDQQTALTGGSAMDIGAIITFIATQATSNPAMSVLIGMTLVAGTVGALFGGFGSMYIIPMIILAAILNWFVFPLGFIVGTGVLPDFLSVPLVVVFNVLMILAVVTFVRGGG